MPSTRKSPAPVASQPSTASKSREPVGSKPSGSATVSKEPVGAKPSGSATASKEPLGSKPSASATLSKEPVKPSAEPTTSQAPGAGGTLSAEPSSKPSPKDGRPSAETATVDHSPSPDAPAVPAATTEGSQAPPGATDPLLPQTEAAPPKLKMQKEVGLFGAVAMLTGIVVGSGIFVSPQFVIKDVGSPMMALAVWFACGVYSTLGALCYAELGVMIPQSGGDYIYIYEAFGSLPAFIFLWVALVVINPITIAVVALSFGNYMVSEFFKDVPIPYPIPRMLGFCLISVLVCLNCYKSRWSQILNTICMVTKIISMLAIIVAAIVYLARGKTENMTKENWLDNANYNPSAFAMAFYGGIFSYAGWNYVNFVTEEMRSPEKNLPRAIYISLPMITLIYVVLNTCYFVAIPAVVFPTVKAVAFTFSENTMGWFRYIIPVGVCVSCMGTVNGMLFAVSRMFFAGARRGHLPELLSMINVKSLTPVPSIIVLGFFSFIYSLNPKIDELLGILCFAVSAVTTMSILALLKMRLWDKRNPNRPLKIFIGIPIVFLILCLYVLVAPFFQKPILLAFASGMILSGIPVYFLFVYWKNKPNWLYKPWKGFTHFVQKLLLCATTEEDKNK
uniref:Large neutral amino acids transporter small subunit 1 n=1 Tax=Panagrellus redivivus TaxID=6233 RepID=A0A7E4UZN3_PANRE